MKRRLAILLSFIMMTASINTFGATAKMPEESKAYVSGAVKSDAEKSVEEFLSSLGIVSATVGDLKTICENYADDYNLNLNAFEGYNEKKTLTIRQGFELLEKVCGTLPEPKGFNLYSKPSYSSSFILKTTCPEITKAGLVPGYTNAELSEEFTVGEIENFFENLFRYYGTNEKDDFFATKNKKYMDSIVLGSEDYQKSVMSDIQENNIKNYDKLLDDIIAGTYAEGTKERQIQDFYKALINKEDRNNRGVEPIKKLLDGIDNANSLSELLTFLKDNCNIYDYPLITFGYNVDLNDSTKSSIYISPAIQQYIASFYDGENTKLSNSMLIDFYTSFFADAGEEEEAAKQDAKNFDSIARAITQATARDNENSMSDYMAGKSFNEVKLSEVQKYYKSLNITQLCKSLGFNVSDDNCYTLNFEATKAWGKYLDNSYLAQLKALAKYNIIDIYAEALELKVYYGKEKAESVDKTEISNDAKNIVKQYLGSYLDQLYCDKYVTPQTKVEVEEMVKEIISNYKTKITNNEWLNDESKAAAIKKLDNIIITVGYPQWSDFSVDYDLPTLENGGNSFTYLSKIYDVLSKDDATKMNKPHNRVFWNTGAVVQCNAEYIVRTNTINIYPGIMQSPLYSSSNSREENLGSIGYIIAHEISHAFDIQGAEYDEYGNENPWWSDEEKATFEDKCKGVYALYDYRQVTTGIATYGVNTANENVADIGGMSCVLDIMKGLENPDYNAFFTSFAGCYAGAATRDYLLKLNAIDPHSNYGVRVNTLLSNFQQFYDTYNITESDGMYIAPEDRVEIW